MKIFKNFGQNVEKLTKLCYDICNFSNCPIPRDRELRAFEDSIRQLSQELEYVKEEGTSYKGFSIPIVDQFLLAAQAEVAAQLLELSAQCFSCAGKNFIATPRDQ